MCIFASSLAVRPDDEEGAHAGVARRDDGDSSTRRREFPKGETHDVAHCYPAHWHIEWSNNGAQMAARRDQEL